MQGYQDANKFIGLFDFLLQETMQLENAKVRVTMLNTSLRQGHHATKDHDVGWLDRSDDHRCHRHPQQQPHER